QDAFIVQNGKLFEVLVTTIQKTDSTAADSQPALSDLQLSYKNLGVQEGCYPNPVWNRILERYRARLSSATVLFPCEALKILQELSGLSDGRMLVLAADKGFAQEEDLAFLQGPPALEFHAPNCFSLMVNFDAFGKYFQAMGGEALVPDKRFARLNICGFLHGQE